MNSIHHEHAQRSLANYLQSLEHLIDAIGGGIIVADDEGRFLRFNDAARRILGLGKADLPPKEWARYYGLFLADGVTPIPPGETPLERALRGEFVRDEEVFVCNPGCPKGAWCRAAAAPIVNDDLHAGIVVFYDVTSQKQALLTRQDGEDRLRAVLETAADAIITIDDHGIIQSFNRAAVGMFGYAGEEVVGQNVSMLMPSPHRERHDDYIKHYLETGEAHIIGIGRQVFGRRKDGSTFPMHLSVSEVEHLGLFTGIIHDLSETSALHQEIVDVAAKEQERIGEDLHDGLGQELTGLGLVVDGLVEKLNAAHVAQALQNAGVCGVAESLGEIAASIRKAREHVRQLARGLVPMPVEDEGLPHAIRRLATTVDEWNDVDCAAVVDDAVEVRDPAAAAHIYRIAQEAVSNALKHSHADTIRIVLRQANSACIVEVIDNGVGINPQQQIPSQGIGLRIMNHRARLIGAQLTVESGADAGAIVRCIYYDHTP